MMKKIIYILLSLLFILDGCEKIHYYPDHIVPDVKTKFLAHRGGGDCNFQENTLKACQYGLPKLSGIEVDLQISKSRTVWLSHSADLNGCGNINPNCFAETYDEDIVGLDSCFGISYDFTRLEEAFKYMSENYPDKYITLDVKEWIPCAASSGNVPDVMNVIADEINRLVKKYNMQNHVMVESEIATFLSYVKLYCKGVETYLNSLGDFERAMQLALEAGYSGISFKYNFDEIITYDHIKMLHRHGLKIQLWTVNTTELLQQALSINPDYIQTDDIDLEILREYYSK
ncbi:MAG: glycerophosphodiester phosphodiesterase [Bacteroidia bacterium]|nr:glycerophosphodiester phosphodiesterase [Bacteroidia bacterium]